jgi:hydroxyacylglutathione hydrolase
MYIQQMEIGSMQNYVYLVGDKETKEVAVIDPAWNVKKILEEAQKNSLKIVAILITHDHPDHTNGVDEILNELEIPIYISKHETKYFIPPNADIRETGDGDTILIGNEKIKCIHTPGHTPGGQCFLLENYLFSGDTLFIDACGRCDLPGSDPAKMYESLQKIKQLQNNIVIYPGHNYGYKPYDTIANQKQTNIYMKSPSKDDFLRNRMGL